MPIYIYKGNSQISTNAIKNDKAVKAIYAKEQGQNAVCVWGIDTSIPYDQMFTYSIVDNTIKITGLKPEVKTVYITIPNKISNKSVTKIADGAFEDKNKIKEMTIPNSVTSIGHSAFQGCTGLTSITIPDSVTSIGPNTFQQCKSLMSVTIPDSVTSIGDSAFYGCTGLTSVILPFVGASETANNGYAKVFGYIFGYTTKTNGSSSVAGATYQYYNDGTYYWYYIPSSIKSVTITRGIIPNRAFNNCSGLTSATMGNSVTSIGQEAFLSCTGLTSVTIGNSVTSIDYEAFRGCNKIQNIYITDIAAWCNISGLNYLMKYGASNKKLYINNDLATSITIPNGVKAIPSYAFSGCTEFTNVTIGNSVTRIDENAFQGCTGLASITIPDSVTFIRDSAFDNTLWYNNQPDGLVYAGKVAYKYKGTMPRNTSIVLEEGTLGIADQAFFDCSSLTSVIIPDSVTLIGGFAFSRCTGLTSVTIPNSVTSIVGSAFAGCERLTSVTIGGSVTLIGVYAFSGCSNLTSITFNGTKAQWNAIYKGTDWNYNTGNYTIHCTDGDIPKS